MESVSHCDERSLLAPQRQQIMSILQVTVLWVTTFFIIFVSVTPQHLVMSLEVSGVQIRIKSCDAREQQLNGRRWRWSDAARWHQDVASCARSQRNNHSLSPGRLSLYVFVCGVMTEYTLQVVHLASTIFTPLDCLWSGAVNNVEEVCLVLPCWSVFKQDAETILSSHSALLLTLNSDRSVESSMRGKDLPAGSHLYFQWANLH